jgi:adenine-specific DNA-methyltransferase
MFSARLGDSLSVMASLAERERLKGKVQCIYFDPPYGIKFNSNWQVSTQSRDVKDGKQTDISREPEQVKAFRDTWKDGIHSYLTYLRDRLTVMRDLLTDSGSIFVQIGDENVHRVRSVLDEVFGEENFVSQIAYQTTTGRANSALAAASNYLLWFAKKRDGMKFRSPLQPKSSGASTDQVYRLVMKPDGSWRRLSADDSTELDIGERIFRADNITSSRPAGEAAALLGLKRCQIFRLLDPLRADGASGLVSRKRGQPGKRRYDDAFCDRSSRSSANGITISARPLLANI